MYGNCLTSAMHDGLYVVNNPTRIAPGRVDAGVDSSYRPSGFGLVSCPNLMAYQE